MSRLSRSPWFWVFLLILSLATYFFVFYSSWASREAFLIGDLVNPRETAFGTKARSEREFKVGIKDFNSGKTPLVVQTIRETLEKTIAGQSLLAPTLVGQPYRLRFDEEPFIFLDFYFDTENFDLDKANAAYRLRYRWKSTPDFVRFINGGRNRMDLPIRCELQCKFEREEHSDGFSVSREARFEFRDESQPFSILYPAPSSPWPFFDFLRIARKGAFEGQIMMPARDCARVLQRTLGVSQVNLKSHFAVLDIRTRFHVLIKTPWGSGPMPDDAFIVTFDNFWYSKRQRRLLEVDHHGGRRGRLRAINNVFREGGAEIEFEFERNVSSKLDEILSAEGSDRKVLQARDAFLKDLTTIKDATIRSLAARSIEAEGMNVSKIRQVSRRWDSVVSKIED